MKGISSDRFGQYEWPSAPPSSGNGIPTYLGISFREDFITDTLDITCDSNGNVYVLENNASGNPVVWGFDDTGTLISLSGSLATDIPGTTFYIDCDLFNSLNRLHLIHTQGVWWNREILDNNRVQNFKDCTE